jgi:hypothetical protein
MRAAIGRTEGIAMSDPLERYNVIWDSPSEGANGSMPLGNGDIGVNVWVEQSGDILLLLAKTDAWDENATLLKLGRVRIRLSPVSVASFKQTLHLRTGEIEITLGGVRVRIRVDANQPFIRIEADSDAPIEMSASLEMWRTKPREIKTQTGDLFKRLGGKDLYPTIATPDHVLRSERNRVVWCHHNRAREHDGFEINMKLQGLGGFIEKMQHPLRGRTFGAAIEGPGFVLAGELTIKSEVPRQRHSLEIHALTLHPSTIEQWQARLDEQLSRVEDIDEARHAHEGWWREFWDRSSIIITSDSPDAFHVTQSYVLQRFMNACAGRGAAGGAIKFNGSIFSVGKPEDPDFRRWGGPGYWFMNQRLIYWPMLAMGDFELMRPWLAMYRDMLPLLKHRTQVYYGHGGAHYPETIMFWGAEVSAHYGWTPFEQRDKPEAECSYVTYYWTGGLELSLILHVYFEMTEDQAFARELLIPIADAVTEFYDLHYPRDESGRLRIEPSQSLETWHEATNPLPDVAGLHYLLPKLLELPVELAPPVMRQRCKRLLGQLPSIPVGEKDGKDVILPAERFDRKTNTENPELYAIFPFRLYGVGKPHLQLARDTFAVRRHPSHECWSQDDIQMAFLGLTEQAKAWITRRAAPASHSDSRFPAFWNAFHDWIPDMDHGGVLQLALQSMLMQCEGRRITLLPAWPKEWEAVFKLHAPYRTIVEGKVRNGWIEDLRVTPEARRADVVIWSTKA